MKMLWFYDGYPRVTACGPIWRNPIRAVATVLYVAGLGLARWDVRRKRARNERRTNRAVCA